MSTKKFWDQKPHLGSEHGPEASLREIILHYYTSHDIPQEKAEEYTNAYIRQIGFPG